MEKEQAELSTEHIEKRLQKSKHSEALGVVAIEKEQARSPLDHFEKIGHVLMSDEPERKPLAEKRVETLNRVQLLELSEKIIIDGTSLRKIYETHLIGERGMRHIVAEYMKDGDLKQALRQEIIERERDFERDPAMRHLIDQSADAANPERAKQALEELLAKTEIASDNRREETAFFKARAHFEAKELTQHKQQRRLLDIALGAIILILLILVILLLMR